MISKGNAYKAVAIAALGVTLTAGRPAVAETMLDQYIVKHMGIAQVNDAGQCLMIVTVNSGADSADEVRVVADNKGAIKLFSAFSAADALVRRAKFNATTDVVLKRKLKAIVVGDPIAELKALHKTFSKEVVTSSASKSVLNVSIAAAVVQGWNVSVGTPYREAYDDMVEVLASLTESNDNAVAKKAFYGTALTAAGISPITYLAI